MNASRICFAGAERTPSPSPDWRAWEIALVVRDGPRRDEFAWFVHEADLNMAEAGHDELRAIRARHPQLSPCGDGRPPLREAQVLDLVGRQLRGATILVTLDDGSDALLCERMRACGIEPTWRRRLIASPDRLPPACVRQALRDNGALGSARQAEVLFDATPQRSPG